MKVFPTRLSASKLMLDPKKKVNALGYSQCIDPFCKFLRGSIIFLDIKKNKTSIFLTKRINALGAAQCIDLTLDLPKKDQWSQPC